MDNGLENATVIAGTKIIDLYDQRTARNILQYNTDSLCVSIESYQKYCLVAIDFI